MKGILKDEIKSLIENTEFDREACLVIDSFHDGYVSSLSWFAHWKDGVQYVGSTGQTLKSAIEEIDFAIKEIKEEAKLT